MTLKGFLYNIDFVVDQDLPDTRKYKASRGYNIDCPFCKRPRKLNVDSTKNVWACPACGEHGGLLDLHANLTGHKGQRGWAKRDLDERYEGLSTEDKESIKKVEDITATKKTEYSDQAYGIKTRSDIINAFLDKLEISDEFLAELHSEHRGKLTDSQIERLKYRTYSEKTISTDPWGDLNLAEYATCIGVTKSFGPVKTDTFVQQMTDVFKRNGSRVPGFYVEDDKLVSFNPGNGVSFLPVRWRHGEISFLQTKFPPLEEGASKEEKESYKKYGRYGSFGPTGCSTSGLQSIHYTGFDYESDDTPETVWLTEGVLKSDIASIKANVPFIALVGISVYSQLPDELKYLKDHGTKTINVAVDMDYRDKISVANSMNRICELIVSSGLKCNIVTWNSQYKGIDDALIASSMGKSDVDFHTAEFGKEE